MQAVEKRFLTKYEAWLFVPIPRQTKFIMDVAFRSDEYFISILIEHSISHVTCKSVKQGQMLIKKYISIKISQNNISRNCDICSDDYHNI